jgi:sec-independent protein translocase protein TatB
MFDIGWSEMMIVGVVALIVVGPKDLPKMFHTVGEFTGKARGMAREFQRAMDAAAKEAGVNDLAKDLRKTASGKALKEAAGFDEIEEEFRALGRERPDVRKAAKGATKDAGTPKSTADADPGAVDDTANDPALAADRAARNAEMSNTEKQRLKKAEKAAEARKRAAEIRAEREADEAEAEAWAPRPRDTGAQPSGDDET